MKNKQKDNHSIKIINSVLGYIRVSTLKQVKGHSLDYQKEAIVEYCKLHKLTLDHIYIDKGISGIKERPEFKKLMKRLLTETKLSGVVVYSFTRFGRSTQDLLFNIEQLKEKEKLFVSIKEQFDISTKIGKMMLTMLAAIAEYERDTILEQMSAGREYAKLHGTKSGKPMHRPKVEIDFGKVRYYRDHKLSWRKTASILNVSTPTLISRAREEGID